MCGIEERAWGLRLDSYWVPGLLFCLLSLVGSVLNALFFSLKVVSKPKAATYAFDFRFITNGSCLNPTPIPAAQTPTSKLNRTCVLQGLKHDVRVKALSIALLCDPYSRVVFSCVQFIQVIEFHAEYITAL